MAGIGPVLLNALPDTVQSPALDVFAFSQLPLPELTARFLASVASSGKLLVLEEHSPRGGIGEHLAAAVARLGIPFRLYHRAAAGYPGGTYGSQSHHQRLSGLDREALLKLVAEITA